MYDPGKETISGKKKEVAGRTKIHFRRGKGEGNETTRSRINKLQEGAVLPFQCTLRREKPRRTGGDEFTPLPDNNSQQLRECCRKETLSAKVGGEAD